MPRPARHLAVIAAGALLAGGCGDYHVVSAPKTVAGSVTLPPIGFNHLYGENPVAARDASVMERQLFAANVYWEVYVYTEPVQAGFVKLGDPAAVSAARQKVTSLLLVVATEDRTTIQRYLAASGKAGQEKYAEELLQAMRGFGYGNITSAEVRVYFSERFEYSSLMWTQAHGYSYNVLLKGFDFGSSPGVTPLPVPETPTTLPTVPSTSP